MDRATEAALAEGAIVGHTHGSCKGNPGPGGAAFLLHFPDGRTDEGTRQSLDTTNNVAEMQAVLDAIAATPDRSTVHIHSVNGYVVESFHRLLPNWQGNGWKKTNGKEVANRDLWEKIALAAKTRNVTFIKIKADSGDPDHEYVAARAKNASELAAKRAFNAAFGG